MCVTQISICIVDGMKQYENAKIQVEADTIAVIKKKIYSFL